MSFSLSHAFAFARSVAACFALKLNPSIEEINDIKTVNQTKNYIPEYVISALKYVNENYGRKL